MSRFSGLFNRSERHADEFWRWFVENEADFYDFEQDQEVQFDALGDKLSKVHPDLTFEFGPKGTDGKRDFVISAGGMRKAFPAVVDLVAAAPELAKWNLLAFRPRRVPVMDVQIEGRKVISDTVRYLIFRDEKPSKVGLMLFLDGYSEAEHDPFFGQAGYLVLDEALGEYDVETFVGAIVFQSHESEYFAQSRVLSELPEHFDEVVSPLRQALGSTAKH